MPNIPTPGGSSLRVEYDPLGTRSQRGGVKRKISSPRRFGLRALVVVVAAVLPFLILVRLSVSLYSTWGWGSWSSVLGAGIATTVLLVIYVWILRVRIQGRYSVPRAVMGALSGLVAAYVLYLLVYLSGANAKNSEVQREFVSLHPVMRVALSSVLLVDQEAIVTDLGRTFEDYRKWGLDVNEASLHFEQSTGFVHAADLRTRGRPAWRNTSIAIYFRVMGFRTLRHVGTADHLHVSLPLR